MDFRQGVRAAVQLILAASTLPWLSAQNVSHLPFCPKKTCLYYAGDFDYQSSAASGILNSLSEGSGRKAEAWVGVRPDRDVSVTGATFNSYLLYTQQVGVNPTPFVV